VPHAQEIKDQPEGGNSEGGNSEGHEEYPADREELAGPPACCRAAAANLQSHCGAASNCPARTAEGGLLRVGEDEEGRAPGGAEGGGARSRPGGAGLGGDAALELLELLPPKPSAACEAAAR
jgi:hypothetical protein